MLFIRAYVSPNTTPTSNLMIPAHHYFSTVCTRQTEGSPSPGRMAASRALRKFPFNLGIGTDICHVVRIRGILKSSRGQRFVQKILNINERAHPKIQWLLASRLENGQAGTLYTQRTLKAHTEEALRNPSQSQPGPDTESIEVAATFMAGRCAVTSSVSWRTSKLTFHHTTIGSQPRRPSSKRTLTER